MNCFLEGRTHHHRLPSMILEFAGDGAAGAEPGAQQSAAEPSLIERVAAQTDTEKRRQRS